MVASLRPRLWLVFGLALAAACDCGASHTRDDAGRPPCLDCGVRDAGRSDGGPGPCDPNLGILCPASDYCDCGGSGCCEAAPGVCRPRPAGCDLLYAPVCGCDGETHGNLCGAHAAGTDARTLGECGTTLACTAEVPCAGGVCVGARGCDGPWQCALTGIACTDDEAPYCGCDGVTFHASGSCPDRPYERPGACEDPVDCSPRRAACDVPPPSCGYGRLPMLVDGCWGPCVPTSRCPCTDDGDCPSGLASCDPTRGVCEDVKI